MKILQNMVNIEYGTLRYKKHDIAVEDWLKYYLQPEVIL